MSEMIQYERPPRPYPSGWNRPNVSAAVDHKRDSLDWVRGQNSLVLPRQYRGHNVRKAESLPVEDFNFRRLANQWRKETAKYSSLSKKVMHPAYQRIIAMGPSVIPLVLREMKRRPGHWFWALDALTQGESPNEAWETLDEATAVWIRWGELKGYL